MVKKGCSCHFRDGLKEELIEFAVFPEMSFSSVAPVMLGMV